MCAVKDFSQPKLVEELWESEHVKQVDCSENISLAVTRGGAVYSWGDGKKSGVLGHGMVPAPGPLQTALFMPTCAILAPCGVNIFR
jgi:hypothetical protein